MKTSGQLLVELIGYILGTLWVRIMGPRKVSSTFTGNDLMMKLPTKKAEEEVLLTSRQVCYTYRYKRWCYQKTLFCIVSICFIFAMEKSSTRPQGITQRFPVVVC